MLPCRPSAATAAGCWLLATLLAGPALPVDPPSAPARAAAPAAADAILDSLAEPLRSALRLKLDRHPDIVRARHRAVAAELRAPQVRSLPNPMAMLGLFLLPPETRVGPQRLTLSLSQRLPWFGTLEARERRALLDALVAREEVEQMRLDRLTEIRRLLFELAFVDQHGHLLDEDRRHLLRHEEVSRARYASGRGLQQAVVKVQAEITRRDLDRLTLEARRSSLLARLGRLLDEPAGADLEEMIDPQFDVTTLLTPPVGVELEFDWLRHSAVRYRPDVRAAEARVEAAAVSIELAEKAFKPDVTLGFTYTMVERRRDAAGRASPPEGNGDDVLALTGAVELPVWRQRLEAGYQEAVELRWAAESAVDQVRLAIDEQLGDRLARLPLLADQWTLNRGVLEAQALEALRSAEAAYGAGNLGALDVLDAEHVLFQVRTQAARLSADYAILLVELEAAVGAPLVTFEGPSTDPEANPLADPKVDSEADSEVGSEVGSKVGVGVGVGVHESGDLP